MAHRLQFKLSPAAFGTLLLLVAQWAALSSALMCAVNEASRHRNLLEVCEYAGTSLTCKADVIPNHKGLVECFKVFETGNWNYCIQNILFDIYVYHEPVKTAALCESYNTSMTVNVNAFSTDSGALLPNAIIPNLALKGNDKTDNWKAIRHLSQIAQAMRVENLLIESLGDKEESLWPTNFRLSFSALHTFHMSEVQISKTIKRQWELFNVKDVQINDLDVYQHAEDEGIWWEFRPPCSGLSNMSFKLNKLRLRNNRVKNYVRVYNNCPNAPFEVKIEMRDIEPAGLLTEEMFRELIIMPRDQRKTEFAADPIKCCDERSRWLFRPNVINNPKLKLDVVCSDLGGKLQEYNETMRDNACRQPIISTPAPTTPPPSSGVSVQLIVIGLISCLILILLAVFIYLRITPASTAPKTRPKVRSQLSSSPSPSASRVMEPINIPSNSLQSDSRLGAQQKQSALSTKTAKSNWSTKRIGKSKRGPQMASPSNIRSVRSR